MYRQLDLRIPEKERKSFGFAHRLHLYSDYSVLVSDYIANGTLQDAINSNVVTGGSMEEVICIYYTIELLQILETLHDVGIVHGDFKPENLLIRYFRYSDRLEASVYCSFAYSSRTMLLVIGADYCVPSSQQWCLRKPAIDSDSQMNQC